MTATATRPRLTVDALKALAANPEFARLAGHALAAETVATATRERVDKYVRVVFDLFTAQFPLMATLCVKPPEVPRPITDPKNIFRCEDEVLCKTYFDLCDKAHRMSGYDLKPGYCPASVAECIQMRAEASVLEFADATVGTPFADAYGDQRKTALKLLMGIALNNPETSRHAKTGLPDSQETANAWLVRHDTK